MINWLLSIDIMGGGGSPPHDMPIKNDSITIELHHVLIVLAVTIGIILLPKFIVFLKKRNDSIEEDDTKSDE